MADFYGVYKGRHCLVEELVRRIAERELLAARECKVATDLQRLFRGKVVRDRRRLMSRAVTQIARVYRGHRSRARVLRLAAERVERESAAVYHYHARSIQRCLRGHLSRKNRYSHARRKAYLREVIAAGEQLRAALVQHTEELRCSEAGAAAAQQQVELARVSANLHHLVSTRACPGVFNSPYLRPDELPTIGGAPVDKHLTTSVKDLLRTRGYAKRSLKPDLTGVLRMPPATVRDKRSLQASEPYDLPQQTAAKEAVVTRLKLLGPREFVAGQKPQPAPYTRGVSEGTVYSESWRNPYLVRGVPASQSELKLPLGGSTGSTLGRAPARPFFTSVGGNKSTVLPNGKCYCCSYTIACVGFELVEQLLSLRRYCGYWIAIVRIDTSTANAFVA
jgi:hypothetical protein